MKRAFIGSFMVAGILVLMAGCGGGGGGGGETPPASNPATTTATSTTSTTIAAAGGEEEAAPLLAWAEGDPDEGKAPLAVQFKAEMEGGTPPFKVTWAFGDGSAESHEESPKHTYDKPGKYRADLNVADAAGDSDSDYVEVEVQ